MLDPCGAGAMELAAALRARRCSPVELVDAHIRRIEQVNPVLNALVANRFDAARGEARAAEDRLGSGHEHGPPLLGVPCTIKEFLAVEGLPQTGGLVRRKGVISTRDATVVQRLRAAGAIVLGVSNVPEGGLWMETSNRIYGRTNNPWNPRRTCGGSSGGEGALVAAGASPFGVGSDIGGSIRIPAAFCGVFGHKPTGRLVPNTGQFGSDIGPANAYLVVGPLTRRAADLMPLLELMAGPDGVDPVCRPFELGDPSAVDLRDVTVYPVESNGRVRVGEVMRAAVRDAARALADRGASVGSLRLPRMRRALEIWGAMLTEATSVSYAEVLGDGHPIRFSYELLRLAVGRGRHTFGALMIASLDGLFARLAPLGRRFAEEGRKLRDELESILGPRGVLLHPPYSRPAPRHRDPWRTPFDATCTALFNVLEVPVTQVPTGFDDAGLPVGVQVVARRGNDHLTIAVAGALEAAFGGWTRAL